MDTFGILSSEDFAKLILSLGLGWAIAIFLGTINAVPEAAKTYSLLRRFRPQDKQSGVLNVFFEALSIYFRSLRFSEPNKTWIHTTLFEKTRKRVELSIFHSPDTPDWAELSAKALREDNPQIEIKTAKHVASAENDIRGYFEAINARVRFLDVMGGVAISVIAGIGLLFAVSVLLVMFSLTIEIAIERTAMSWPVLMALPMAFEKFFLLTFGALAAGTFAAILIDLFFRLQSKSAKSKIVTFLTPAHVEDAFIAPLHLVAGLLHRVDQEWGDIIDVYNTDIHADPPHAALGKALKRLRTIQKFTFDCWLLWGPSIPICDTRCGQNGGDMQSIQLGYGDENSSIEIIGSNSWMDDRMNFLSKSLIGNELAINVKASGWLSHTDHRPALNIAKAIVQSWGADKNGRTLLLMDNRDGQKGTIELKSDRSFYYTAYLWVGFVILHQHEQQWRPVHQGSSQNGVRSEAPWLDFLPFFEHGNIGDDKTYQFLQHQLASKALEGIGRLLKDWRADHQEKYPLRFAYACAIDHAGCGRDIRFARKSDGGIRELLKKILSEKLLNEELLNEKLLKEEKQPMKDYEQLGEILDFSEEGSNHAACGMPEMIGSFYKHVVDVVDENRKRKDTMNKKTRGSF